MRELLAIYPVHGDELRQQREEDLRDLFASLDLLVSYDHERHVAKVRITLAAAQRDAFLGAGWLPQLDPVRTIRPLVEGQVISLASVHAKIRRDGYHKHDGQ